MTGWTYVVTEGVHDVAFLAKLIGRRAFRSVGQKASLPEAAQRWLDGFKWPLKDDIARLAVPAPLFYERSHESHIVVISNAVGLGGIEKRLVTDLEGMSKEGIELAAVAIVRDTDDSDAAVILDSLRQTLRSAGLPVPQAPDIVAHGPPRAGIFAMPDGASNGTLENLLLSAGANVYSELHADAVNYVAVATPHLAKLDGKEREDFSKPAGPMKATLAAMTAMLKPGKAIQTSITDHRWVSDETTGLAEFQPLIAFLDALLAP
ncbi:MAG TPA: DUF3226 domain-containing protein [Byssovorax sp.]|jgi:hypothetical protein